jgi:saccharopine dehydrogenase (NAD+, L-lysine forming)
MYSLAHGERAVGPSRDFDYVTLRDMRVLVVGSGGVGAAFAAIAQRRPVFTRVVMADVALERAQAVAERLGEPDRFGAERVDASNEAELVELIGRVQPDAVLNACDPRFNEPIFDACLRARVTYLDMAMTLSRPHPERPYELTGTMLGDYQLQRNEAWEQAGLLALVGIGVEPGLSDIFARHAADELFLKIEEVGVRDGADLVVEGYDFAPTFSIWTTIEECLNPPLIWERARGFYTTEPFSEPEVFEFPEGIGKVECVNVEHEEVVLIPRWVNCERVTFKYGLGLEFIDVLSTLHKLGLDSTDPISVRGRQVAPRDVVAAALPDPATLGERMSGCTCAGTWVTGTGLDGRPRSTYLYHVVDNETTMREYGSQAVVWQTAINPVVALELLDRGEWKGTGVLGPEAFAPGPFLDLLAEYGAPHGQMELPS